MIENFTNICSLLQGYLHSFNSRKNSNVAGSCLSFVNNHKIWAVFVGAVIVVVSPLLYKHFYSKKFLPIPPSQPLIPANDDIIKTANDTIAQLKEKIQRLEETQKASLQKQSEEKQQEIVQLTRSKDSQIAEIQKRLDHLTRELSVRDQELEIHRSQLSTSLEEKPATERSDLETKKADLEAQLATQQKEKSQLIEAKNAEIAHAKESLEQLTGKISELEASLQKQSEEQQQEIAKLTRSKDIHIAQAQQKLDELTRELSTTEENLKSRIGKLETSLEEEKREAEKAAAERSVLETKKVELEGQLATQQKENSQLIEAKNAEIAHAKESLEQLTGKISELEASLQKQSEEQQQEIAQLTRSKDSQIAQTQQNLDELTRKLSDTEEKSKCRINELETSLEEEKRKAEKAVAERSDLEAKKIELKAQLATQQTENSQLIEDKDAHIAQAKESLKQLTNKISELEKSAEASLSPESEPHIVSLKQLIDNLKTFILEMTQISYGWRERRAATSRTENRLNILHSQINFVYPQEIEIPYQNHEAILDSVLNLNIPENADKFTEIVFLTLKIANHLTFRIVPEHPTKEKDFLNGVDEKSLNDLKQAGWKATESSIRRTPNPLEKIKLLNNFISQLSRDATDLTAMLIQEDNFFLTQLERENSLKELEKTAQPHFEKVELMFLKAQRFLKRTLLNHFASCTITPKDSDYFKAFHMQELLNMNEFFLKEHPNLQDRLLNLKDFQTS